VERISQLMDGELDSQSARQALIRLRQHDGMRENWDTFHLIGDALRGEETLSPEFGRRFAQRLAGEPTVLAPARSTAPRITAYTLSAAASLAAVALVGWLAVGTRTATTPPVELANTPAAALAEAAPEPAPAPKAQLASEPYDGTLNEYLMAHTGFSPSTVIQGVAPYIRTVAASHSDQNR
jgi:sigma-E factor negative regulatory protein RseA